MSEISETGAEYVRRHNEEIASRQASEEHEKSVDNFIVETEKEAFDLMLFSIVAGVSLTISFFATFGILTMIPTAIQLQLGSISDGTFVALVTVVAYPIYRLIRRVW